MHEDDYPTTLSEELLDLLGGDDFLLLTENYGGLRCYISSDIEKSGMTETLGHDVMSKLQSRYGGDTIRIPLARRFRATQYRERGLTDREIARKLQITETGVEKLFKRHPVKRPPRQQKTDPRQIDMFNSIALPAMSGVINGTKRP